MDELLKDKIVILISDIEKKITDFDKRRKYYKSIMRICHIVLSIVSVVPLVCVSLSFIKDLDIVMRVLAIVVSAMALLMTRILKVEVYNLKLFQRTKTCLGLRDLLRQIKYEDKWNEETVKKYTQDFRKIMEEDMDMSLKNMQLQIENERELFQDEIIS